MPSRPELARLVDAVDALADVYGLPPCPGTDAFLRTLLFDGHGWGAFEQQIITADELVVLVLAHASTFVCRTHGVPEPAADERLEPIETLIRAALFP